MGFWNQINPQNTASGFWNAITGGVHSQVAPFVNNFTGVSQDEWNEKQYQLQKDTLNYNKELNEKLMQREDTEYSRSISDMMSAGLNPAMLYGGSAGSLSSSAGNQLNSAPSTQALPAGSLAELAGFVMNMKNVLSQVEKNNAETKNIEEDTFGKKLKNIYQQVENTYQDIQKKQSIVSEWIKQHGNKYSNSLLEGEVKGRARDGTYQNQPVYSNSESTSVNVGPIGFSSSSSETSPSNYKNLDWIPYNDLSWTDQLRYRWLKTGKDTLGRTVSKEDRAMLYDYFVKKYGKKN